jgi:Uma2 family endonuclease
MGGLRWRFRYYCGLFTLSCRAIIPDNRLAVSFSGQVRQMALPIPHKLFTVEEYEQMISAGILAKDDRLELLRGEIVEMAPIGLRHASCVARVSKLLERVVGDSGIVWGQNPVLLPNESLPQPDVTLLKWRADFYTSDRPRSDDIILLIEVADSSLWTDRSAKVPIYAEAGIDVLGIVNLLENSVEVYTNPQNGHYSDTQTLRRGQNVRLPEPFDAELTVDDIIG